MTEHNPDAILALLERCEEIAGLVDRVDDVAADDIREIVARVRDVLAHVGPLAEAHHESVAALAVAGLAREVIDLLDSPRS